MNNGENVSFWLDVWLEDTPLCLCDHVLYDLSLNQGVSVDEVAMNDGLFSLKSNYMESSGSSGTS
jgi:hypothetical protein